VRWGYISVDGEAVDRGVADKIDICRCLDVIIIVLGLCRIRGIFDVFGLWVCSVEAPFDALFGLVVL
jgi:hypothetical protein